ncbi:MAG: MFS transporter [Caldilineaceae bacterium]
MTRKLGLSAGLIGIIFGVGSAGFLAGALLSGRLSTRIGLGPMLIVGLIILAVSDFALPLAAGPKWLVVAILSVAQICFGLGLTFYNVGQVSLRQAITPDYLLGRMNATLTFAVAGLIPLGALLGGFAGGWIGLRTTLLLSAGGELLAVMWLFFSPVRKLRG